MPSLIGSSVQTSGVEVAPVAEVKEVPALVLELGIVLLAVLVVLLALRRVIVRAKGRVATTRSRREGSVDPWSEAGRRLEVGRPSKDDPSGPLQ